MDGRRLYSAKPVLDIAREMCPGAGVHRAATTRKCAQKWVTRMCLQVKGRGDAAHLSNVTNHCFRLRHVQVHVDQSTMVRYTKSF